MKEPTITEFIEAYLSAIKPRIKPIHQELYKLGERVIIPFDIQRCRCRFIKMEAK